jgi:hypothetical protein
MRPGERAIPPCNNPVKSSLATGLRALPSRRKPVENRSSLLWLTLDRDVRSYLLDDAETGGKPKPGPPPRRLGTGHIRISSKE